LGTGASWVYRQQAVTIPAEEAEDPEVVSVASHSTHSLFGSDVEMEVEVEVDDHMSSGCLVVW
jgi:hypothetical protein